MVCLRVLVFQETDWVGEAVLEFDVPAWWGGGCEVCEACACVDGGAAKGIQTRGTSGREWKWGGRLSGEWEVRRREDGNSAG